jgi:Outer membrane cobalamin receptor protein
MRNIISGLFLAGLFLLNCSLSSAETATPLEPLVVSATRWETSGIPTAGSLTVITRDEIVASGASRIVDVLRGRGGIQIRDFFGDGSRARVDMRGFGDTAGSNTLILVDGRRLNNTDLHDPDLNFIPSRMWNVLKSSRAAPPFSMEIRLWAV